MHKVSGRSAEAARAQRRSTQLETHHGPGLAARVTRAGPQDDVRMHKANPPQITSNIF